MSVVVTPSMVQDIVDSVDERELWIVGREFERPPYFHAGKGGDTRLARALRLCTDDKITPNSDGSYQVAGSESRSYRVGDSCSCPQSQKANSKWCYHAVGVALYVEWQRRLRPVAPMRSQVPTSPLAEERAEASDLGNGYPVDDETLPLPLSPVTIDERLAALPAKEDRMPADTYIPEPVIDDAPVAVLEPRNGMSHDTPMATPLATALVQWSAQRQVVKEFLSRELREGIDFYTLQIRGKASKPSLSKAGAEKFLGLMQLQASFAPDLGTWEMLGKPTDQIMYVCQLRTRSGEIVGEGRGARSLKQDGGDINKALKMSEKSALIDAVLRTGALSDAFTQDLENEDAPAPTKPATPNSSELRRRIWSLVTTADASITNREACEAYVQRMTGLALEPNNYSAIEAKLQEG